MKALIVDDSRILRTAVRAIVRPLGLRTMEARNGRVAFDLIEDGKIPDIAVVDWTMPVMSGLQFVQAVRARPRYHEITLIMALTEDEQEQTVRALAAGAHDYVLKPYTEAGLVATLDRLGLLGTQPVRVLASA